MQIFDTRRRPQDSFSSGRSSVVGFIWFPVAFETGEPSNRMQQAKTSPIGSKRPTNQQSDRHTHSVGFISLANQMDPMALNSNWAPTPVSNRRKQTQNASKPKNWT